MVWLSIFAVHPLKAACYYRKAPQCIGHDPNFINTNWRLSFYLLDLRFGFIASMGKRRRYLLCLWSTGVVLCCHNVKITKFGGDFLWNSVRVTKSVMSRALKQSWDHAKAAAGSGSISLQVAFVRPATKHACELSGHAEYQLQLRHHPRCGPFCCHIIIKKSLLSVMFGTVAEPKQ